jgi:hypothetical protein
LGEVLFTGEEDVEGVTADVELNDEFKVGDSTLVTDTLAVVE